MCGRFSLTASPEEVAEMTDLSLEEVLATKKDDSSFGKEN